MSLEPLESRQMLMAAPVVDLNGAGSGTGYTASWNGTALVSITDFSAATVTDDDGGNLASMTVTLASLATGDVLAANISGTSISQSYSGGTLSLTGSDTIADYQTVLRTLTYNNTAGGPGVAVKTASITANDGSLTSTPVTATINMPAPTVVLTVGSGSGTPNFTTSWYNSGSVPIENNVQATVGALSGITNLQSLTVTLATFHTGDVLSVPILSGVSVTTSYSSGTLTISGNESLAHYQQELRFISYNNTAGGPGVTSTLATFVADDGSHTSTPVTATVNVKVASGQVLGNRLFYNNSKYDGGAGSGNAAINANDDLAIASDKTGWDGTGTATFANISAFTKGITGIMVDLQSGIGSHSAINLTSGDLLFKVSPSTFVTTTYNQLSTWFWAPTPSAVSVRMGAGTGGSDRLEITWPTGAIKNTWLAVEVLSGGNTGLSANDVFYFGSVVGNSGSGDTASFSKTDVADYLAANNNVIGLTTPVWNLVDYSKDAKVDIADSNAALNGVFTLHYLTSPAVQPPLGGVNLSFGATPISVNGDGHLQVTYQVDQAISVPDLKFVISLTENTAAGKVIGTTIVDASSLAANTEYTQVLDSATSLVDSGTLGNFNLEVNLDATGTMGLHPVSQQFQGGLFKMSTGQVEIFGDPSGTGATTVTATRSGTTLNVSYNGGTTQSFAGATSLAVRIAGGTTSVSADDLDIPLWAYGAAGAANSLTLSSDVGGAIASDYSSGLNTFAVDGVPSAVVAGQFATFVLNAKTVSLNNIALSQYFDVTNNDSSHISDITLSGGITVNGFSPPSNHTVLVRNESSATLHGGFTSGDLTPINDQLMVHIGSTYYEPEYVNDVTLDSETHVGDVQVTPSQIITPEDTIPRFVNGWLASGSTNLNKSIASGAWSDTSIWSLGHVPTTDELVRIAAGTEVDYSSNDSTHAIKAIEVDGSLIFDHTVDTELKVGTVEVMPGGTLQIGSSADPIAVNKTAKLTIADQALDDGTGGIDLRQYGTGLIAFGTVSIHGAPIGDFDPYVSSTDSLPAATTWLNLADEPLAGQSSLTVDGTIPDGWVEGAVLVLPDTRQNATGHLEEVTIDHVTGSTIYLTAALAYDHKGAYGVDPETGGRDTTTGVRALPQVALLTRNVIISSPEGATTRGHTLYGGRASVDIENADFRDLGRTLNQPVDSFNPTTGTVGTNQTGRYPVHFHHLWGPETTDGADEAVQFTFTGNTVEGFLKWGVAVHDTGYGVLENNVIYDGEGAGFVGEEGTEIGNRFVANMTVYMHGDIQQANENEKERLLAGDFANNGTGFWFRRGGNTVSGNVTADNSYAGFVFDSYYLWGQLSLPVSPGADTHLPDGSGTNLSYLNPAMPFANNTVFGRTEFGVWLTYISGDNLKPNDTITVLNLTMWNAAWNTYAYVYHTANVTLDNLTILADPEDNSRFDAQTRGISMATYENRFTLIENSDVEGVVDGLFTPVADATGVGNAPEPTVIQNTTFKNFLNVRVGGTVDGGTSNHVLFDHDVFIVVPPFSGPGTTAMPNSNIWMDIGYPNESYNYTIASVVQVTDSIFNDRDSASFQVYYKEQAADAIMRTTMPDSMMYSLVTQIGAPTGSRMTNQQAWDTYHYATGGFLAPDDATEANADFYGIDGLVGPAGIFEDPSTLSPLVVLVTPWTDEQYVRQPDHPYVEVRYNVQGIIPTGEKVQFSLSNGSITTTYDSQDKIDNLYSGGSQFAGTAVPLTPGNYTLRAYLINISTGVEVSGTGTCAAFEILDNTHLYDVDLAPILDHEDPGVGMPIHELLAQAGVPVNSTMALAHHNRNMAIAITSSSVATGQGVWQYWDPHVLAGWHDLPSGLSATNAFVIPHQDENKNLFLLRFKVADGYDYDDADGAPTLTFQTYDIEGNTTRYLDLTGDSHAGADTVTVTQPILAAP